MKSHSLAAKKRTETGRKVKALRNAGIVPATVYGKKSESVSISIDGATFAKTYRQTGETGLIELSIDGQIVPVLIPSVQRDPVKDTILHVEFYQVNLKEKVKTNVPIVSLNDAPAVVQKLGVLLMLLSEVEVEALPADLPEKIEVDVSGLAEVDQELKVSDLHPQSGVTIITDGSLPVVKIGALVSKEAEEQAASEAAAATPAEGESATAATPEDSSGAKAPEETTPEKK